MKNASPRRKDFLNQTGRPNARRAGGAPVAGLDESKSPLRSGDHAIAAVTSRQKDTQVDSEFQMTDELLGSSGSQFQPVQTISNVGGTTVPGFTTTSIEQQSTSHNQSPKAHF